jgi:hypothetical protein
VKELYPAGTIRIDRRSKIPDGATLRILALDTRGLYRPFDRKIGVKDATARARFPAGRVIAGIFDREGHALSMMRPAMLRAGDNIRTSMREPGTQNCVVLAILNRWIPRPPLPSCTGHLLVDGRAIRPDVDMQAFDRVVLTWYGVRSQGAGVVNLRCGSETLLTAQIRLRHGSIATIRARLPPVTRPKE